MRTPRSEKEAQPARRPGRVADGRAERAAAQEIVSAGVDRVGERFEHRLDGLAGEPSS